MNCHEYTVHGEIDSAGQPMKHWRCYCGTTDCLKQFRLQDFASVETVTQKRVDELTREEKKAFYRKVFHTKLSCEDENCPECHSRSAHN